jgi:outer membrane immunogenic protein
VNGPGSNQPGSVATTRTGYAAGAGVEYAIDRHWDLRAEYLYVNLGHVDLFTTNPLIPLETTTQSATFSMNIVRTGVDYKFGP